MNPPDMTEAGVAAWLRAITPVDTGIASISFATPATWLVPARAVLALVASEKSALIERLRVAGGLLRDSRDELPCPGDNRYGETVRDLLANIDTFLGASHVAR